MSVAAFRIEDRVNSCDKDHMAYKDLNKYLFFSLLQRKSDDPWSIAKKKSLSSSFYGTYQASANMLPYTGTSWDNFKFKFHFCFYDQCELKSNALVIYMYNLTAEINKHSSNIFGKIII